MACVMPYAKIVISSRVNPSEGGVMNSLLGYGCTFTFDGVTSSLDSLSSMILKGSSIMDGNWILVVVISIR